MSAVETRASIESLSNLERRMTLRLPAERLETQVGGRLREISRTVRIKGFRPGKVPAKVIEQRYGKQVRAEVLDGLLRQGFDEAVRENELKLAGNPKIEPNAGEIDSELSYVATFEVVPDFGDVDMSKLNVVRHTSEVSDQDIDKMIENLRVQRRTWSVVTRGAQAGDAVDVETWTQVGEDRIPAEGSERGTTVIGSNGMLPDIENALTGMAADAKKEVEIDFPAQWRMPQLAGRTATVYLHVTQVSEPVLPEVDADFIRSFGVKSGNLEQFQAEIRSNLERELQGALMNRLRREVGEQLIASYAEVEMPPRLVENEARAMAQRAYEQARQQGQRMELPVDAHTAFLDAARKRVLVGLLVGEVARRNGLTLDTKRLNETLRMIASTYEEPKQVIDLYRNDPQLMSGLQNRVMEEQVTDWIAERAQHTEQSLTFQEAIAPQ